MKKVMIALLLLVAAAGARAATLSCDVHTAFWWTLYEQVENGLFQAGSGDEAADVASGFNLRQGRLGFTCLSDDGKLEGVVRLRLEERPDIVDFYGVWHINADHRLLVGQMKIPGSAELLTAGHERDFILKTALAEHLGDYSLSRTPYISSIMSAKSWDRDLGVAAKGRLAAGGGLGLEYFLMLGNGLGAGKFIGGDSDEFLYTNRPGDWFYAGRIEADARGATLGIHGSFNKHDDVAVGARGPVFDLDRRVAGLDLSLNLPRGLRLAGFWCRGWMEDYWTSTAYEYDFDGFGGKALLAFAERWEAGVRYDAMSTEYRNDGLETTDKRLTLGLNYRPHPLMRLQFNYITRELKDDYTADLDDDAIHLGVDFRFDA